MDKFFESPTDVCDDCESEMVAWFKAPMSGIYTFIIASDNLGHLFFGPEEDRADLIAQVPGYTSARQWLKYPAQTSRPLRLVGDDYYFMKAISNEGSGGDNLAVAAQLPDGTMLAPIPVVRAAGHGDNTIEYLFTSSDIRPPPPQLPGLVACPACSEGITYRRWNTQDFQTVTRAQFLADPTFLDDSGPPDEALLFTDAMEVPVNGCEPPCGRELTAYFKAPVSGTYVFSLASDDQGSLWFGATEASATNIATVPGWAGSRQWDKYPEQTSDNLELVVDNYYYLKALGVEGGGGDNLAVAVRLPTGEFIAPITVVGGYLYTSADIDAAAPAPPAVTQCSGADSCGIDACMQGMIDGVTRACCPDPALCPNGAPVTCDTRCSAPFMTLYSTVRTPATEPDVQGCL